MVTTYPLNDVDYDAADAELFHCTRTSGIFDGTDFVCSVTGADNNVTVGVGIGWIRNNKFSGKVVALKEQMVLDMGVADTTYPRIDAVAIQFDSGANKTEIVAVHGTPAANPVPPSVTREDGIYELHLYHVRREAGATAISVGNLTDVRMNEAYCGLMQDDVTPRESAITAERLPVVPVSKGGTGATTIAGARKALGLGNTSGALPIADGGTGETTAEGARAALGAAPEEHHHAASDIASGTLSSSRLPTVPLTKGGTGATSGQAGLMNLLAAGYMVASGYQLVDSVDEIPTNAPENALFLVLEE